MLNLINGEQVIVSQLADWGFKCELQESKTTDSVYYKTNRGIRVRLSDHPVGDRRISKIIPLDEVRNMDELYKLIQDRNYFLAWKLARKSGKCISNYYKGEIV